MSQSMAVDICRTLQLNRFEAVLIGGCVRDELLGLEPKDYDVATNATPEQVLGIFNAELVGAKFGVCLVKSHFPNENAVEVATYRKEGCYTDGRRPDSVTFAETLFEDVRRRDFTINAIAFDPQREAYYDYTGGIKDLLSGTLRCVGNPEKRFEEDHLRMLRAVRFASRLGFIVERRTFDALIVHSYKILGISKERIAGEISRMLTQGNADKAFDLLCATGLLRQILPEMMQTRGLQQPAKWHPEGDVWTHIGMCLSLLEQGCSLTLALAVLLHDIAKPITFEQEPGGEPTFHGHAAVGADMAREWLIDYRFPNDVIERVTWLVENHMRIKTIAEMRRSKQLALLAEPGFVELCELNWIDCLASNGDLSSDGYAIGLMHDQEAVKQATAAPLLNGNDVMSILGIPAGPKVGAVLTYVRNQQLDGTISTYGEAVEALQTAYKGEQSGNS